MAQTSGPPNRSSWAPTNETSGPPNRPSGPANLCGAYSVPNAAFSTRPSTGDIVVETRGTARAQVAAGEEEEEVAPESCPPHSACSAEEAAAELAAFEGLEQVALEGLAPPHTIHIHTRHILRILHILHILRIPRILHTHRRYGPGPRENILFVNPERA